MSHIFVIPGASPSTPEYTIFGADNHLYGSTFTGASEDADYPLANAFDWRDNTEFSPETYSGGQVFTVTQTTVGQFDYLGVFSKNAGTVELQLTVEVLDIDTASYVEVAFIDDFEDGKPRLVYFGDQKTQGYYEAVTVRLTFEMTGKLYVTALHMGKGVVFEYTPSLGFTPAHLNPQDDIENFKTQGNNFIVGRRIRNGYTAKGVINFIHFDDINAWWPDFQQHVLNSRPLFFAWSNSQPNQVVYGLQDPKSLARPSYVTSFHGNIEFEINGYA
jgi:hypothetical protein